MRSSHNRALLCPITLDLTTAVILLGRVAVGAQRPIVVKLSLERSVCRSVQCIVENGGSDPAAVWHRKSDGSRDEARGGIWRSVRGKGYFWGRILGRAIVFSGDFTAYVCDSSATRPSSQLTLGRLVSVVTAIT